MQFLTQRQELAAQLGLDQSNADTDVLLKRWLNTSQQIISQAAEWPFLRSSTPLIVQTVADITAGTVATTAGSAAITFSSPPAVSVQEYYIQTSSASDWYQITAHTANVAGATISPVAIYADTAATFIARKFFYALDSTVDRVLQIRQAVTPFQLEELDKESFDKLRPNPAETGIPRIFVMAGKNSSDVWQFVLWPTPDEVVNLHVDYIKAAVDLVSDTETSIIPAKWHTSVMLEGAKWQGWQFLDDTRADKAKENFYDAIGQMEKEMMPSRGLHRVMRSIDSQEDLFPFPLPANYPNV